MAGGMETRTRSEAAAEAAGRIPGVAADIHIALAEGPRSLGMAARRSLAGAAVGRILPARAEVADSRTGPVAARRRAAGEVAAGSNRRLAERGVLSWVSLRHEISGFFCQAGAHATYVRKEDNRHRTT